jgi:GT2 family glycosyltransferase
MQKLTDPLEKLDINLEKQEQQKKEYRVIFAIPGDNFPINFMRCWSELLIELSKTNIIPILSLNHSSMVHFARAMCLGANIKRGKNQKPFDGKVEYDYIMWIDSDIYFTTKLFVALLKQSIEKDLDINSGIYLTHDNNIYPVVDKYNKEYLMKNGKYEFWTREKVENFGKDLTEVSVEYNGMGFMLIKEGVIEKLEYPWFRSTVEIIDEETGVQEIISEDVYFCRALREAGFRINVNPQIKVGHIKKNILYQI